MLHRPLLGLIVALLAVSALGACGGGGGSSTVAPTPAPGAVVASPNPLVLGVAASDANHIVALTITQSNAAGLATVSQSSGCAGFVTQSNPFSSTESYDGTTLNMTFSSFIGAAVLAQGTCTITVTPTTGTALVVPVSVVP